MINDDDTSGNDWFGKETSAREPSQADQSSDDWLVDRELRPRPAPLFEWQELRELANRKVLAPAAIFVVLLMSLLAAAGVFNSTARQPIAPIVVSTTPEIPTPPTTTATATTGHVPASVPTGTLKPGDTGTQVKLLQQALVQLGYSPGAIDGAYGPSTTGAVAAFQRTHRLTADGVVGPQTLHAITLALAP